jgi:starch phosphorylase
MVVAVAYDTPVPGYGTYNTNNMRLWASKPSHEFDLASFNAGDYYGAVEAKERCESITSVLYPSDDNVNGKVLRLKQQFFFVSATLQDILRRYKKRIVPGRTLKNLPDKVANPKPYTLNP